MSDPIVTPDGGLLAKALQVRLTAVLADGRVVRFETGHPAAVTVRMRNDIPLSRIEPLAGARYDTVDLLIKQGFPCTVQHATVHQQTPVSWSPLIAYENWAGLTPPAPELPENATNAEKDASREADEEGAFLAGVAAFLDSITDPADQGRFTVTVHAAEGGTHTQRCDQRWLARTLVNMAQAPHVVHHGDRWVIERENGTPEDAGRREARLAGTMRYILADLGLDPDSEQVRAVVNRRLDQAAQIAVETLK